MKRATEKHHVVVAKIRFVAELPVTACSKCGESYMEHDVLAGFERAVARRLAERGPATGETFRFMRKAVALPAKEVAELLRTTPETVSRWETGGRPVDRNAWTTLSSLVLDEISGGHAVRERLRTLQSKPPVKAKPVRIELVSANAQ
jgi:DNA-binding transcriptional regulator YiaG